MLNPMRDNNEGTYVAGGKGMTPVTTAFAQKIAEGKTSEELGWKAKVMEKNTHRHDIHIL